ncbi:MAG: DUF4079 family protein [Candidatus Binatia bacterium]
MRAIATLVPVAVLPYIHPVTAAVAVALLGYVGSLALRARNDKRRAHELFRRHARLAPIMYALILVTWLSGLLSTWLVRRDLAVAASAHFRIGTVLIVVLSGGAGTSRWMGRSAARFLHPWFGGAAMLLAAAQVFFGLQITP